MGSEIEFGRISSITPLGNRLVVTDRFTSPHITVLDATTGTVLRRFGRDGGGPKEFKDPRVVEVLSTTPTELRIHDFKRQSMVAIRWKGRSAPVEFVNRTKLATGGYVRRPVRIDGRYLANGAFPGHLLVELDSTGGVTRRFSLDLPHDVDEIGHPTGAMILNMNNLVVHPQGDRIAVAYHRASRLDVIDLDKWTYRTTIGPRPLDIDYHVADQRFYLDTRHEVAYFGAAATDARIYVLHCGGCDKDRNLPNLLHIYSWKGELQAEFHLGKPISAVAVDGTGDELYGAYAGPEPRIGIWTLPNSM